MARGTTLSQTHSLHVHLLALTNTHDDHDIQARRPRLRFNSQYDMPNSHSVPDALCRRIKDGIRVVTQRLHSKR